MGDTEPKAEPSTSTAANPPKKRSFFKKPSWQSETKGEGKDAGAVDFFSHSSDYKDIVAEQAKRRKEKLAKEEEKKKRKAEERESKRRRISEEDEGLAGRSSVDVSNKERSKTPGDIKPAAHSIPPSPVKHSKDPNSLSARYDSVTKLSTPKKSTIIELSEPSDEDSDPAAVVGISKANDASIPSLPSKPAPIEIPDEEPEEEEDPEFRALAAKARARRKAEEAAKAANNSNSATPDGGSRSRLDQPDPVVILLLESAIPETTPLLVKVRLSSTLEKPKKAWCERQGFSKEKAASVFLTWRYMTIYDTTTIARLGVNVDGFGNISVKDDNNIYTDDDPPKIHLQAWTQELFDAAKKEQDEARKRETEPDEEEVVVEQPKAVDQRPRLFLKAKGIEEFRIRVKPDTTFEHLQHAYRQARNIPPDKHFYFMFDGERLKPFDTIADSEIEDNDSVEVHFK